MTKLLATAEELNVIIAMREKKATWETIAKNTSFTLSQLKVIRKEQLKVTRPDLVLNIGPVKGENRYANRTSTTSLDVWAVFEEYASDANNWGGTPLVYDWKATKSGLMKLVKMGLVRDIMVDAGERWVMFSEAGRQEAIKRGHCVVDWSLTRVAAPDHLFPQGGHGCTCACLRLPD